MGLSLMWTTGPGCALEDLTETNRDRGLIKQMKYEGDEGGVGPQPLHVPYPSVIRPPDSLMALPRQLQSHPMLPCFERDETGRASPVKVTGE